MLGFSLAKSDIMEPIFFFPLSLFLSFLSSNVFIYFYFLKHNCSITSLGIPHYSLQFLSPLNLPVPSPYPCSTSEKNSKQSKQANKQTKKTVFTSPSFRPLQHLFIPPGGIGSSVSHSIPFYPNSFAKNVH